MSWDRSVLSLPGECQLSILHQLWWVPVVHLSSTVVSASCPSCINCCCLIITQEWLWVQALDYYNKAVEHNPKDESALLNRAITKVTTWLHFNPLGAICPEKPIPFAAAVLTPDSVSLWLGSIQGFSAGKCWTLSIAWCVSTLVSSTYLGAQPASWVVLEGGKTCRTRSAGLAVVHNHRQEADERETNLLGFFCCWYHKCETDVDPDHHLGLSVI